VTVTVHPVRGRLERRHWFKLPEKIYRAYPHHRATEGEIARWLVNGTSIFCRHATVTPYLIKQGRRAVGRFALVKDEKLPDYVQVSFFQAHPGLQGVRDAILLRARAQHPECGRVVVGLDGHLNFACGFLASNFDEPPLFGLPYTPPYYLDYFDALPQRGMVSYRFQNQGFYDLRRAVEPNLDLGGLTIRLLDPKNFRRDIDIYTYLNNACFEDHPYWSKRTGDEDFELFWSMRLLLKPENFIFAEKDGKPVGFLLWYPDYNELCGPGRELGLRDVLRFRLRNPIKTVRLTEIAVHPEFRSKKVVAGMKMKMIEHVERGGYSFTEGGFIFEENKSSIGSTLAYIARAMGRELEPYRRFCVFEEELG